LAEAAGQRAIHLKRNSSKTFTLTFDLVEPYVVPRTSLTGDSTERVDVRVLQVIYGFRPLAFPVYVGQQEDVLIVRIKLDMSGLGYISMRDDPNCLYPKCKLVIEFCRVSETLKFFPS
jgi:hypothetical protein